MSTPTSPPLSRLAYAYAYRGPVPGLVRALKYGSAGCLAGFMAADMARACAALQLPQTPLAVPAPMHPRRERKRGYNQAELLCRELARMLGCPYAQALRKLRNTRQQARLDHEARTRNLEGSVGVCADVRGRVILLVDDVYTTGATMRVCASALLAAGAKSVYGLAYAGAGQARPASDLGKGLERLLCYSLYCQKTVQTFYSRRGMDWRRFAMTVLETKDLKKYYGRGDTLVKALDGVSLRVEDGEFVAIVGTSGSGKSTLLHMLGGLDRPDSGSVTVAGKEIFSLKDEALTIFRRRKIGFVFQSYNLVPVLTAYENIVLPIQLDGGRVDKAYVKEVISTLGLAKKLDNLPSQLSGGQQQRVAIARALASKPAILLADEPTGNLDSRTSQDVLSLMKVTGRRFAQTMVMITHNEEIAQLADRIVRIEDGRIVKR